MVIATMHSLYFLKLEALGCSLDQVGHPLSCDAPTCQPGKRNDGSNQAKGGLESPAAHGKPVSDPCLSHVSPIQTQRQQLGSAT